MTKNPSRTPSFFWNIHWKIPTNNNPPPSSWKATDAAVRDFMRWIETSFGQLSQHQPHDRALHRVANIAFYSSSFTSRKHSQPASPPPPPKRTLKVTNQLIRELHSPLQFYRSRLVIINTCSSRTIILKKPLMRKTSKYVGFKFHSFFL